MYPLRKVIRFPERKSLVLAIFPNETTANIHNRSRCFYLSSYNFSLRMLDSQSPCLQNTDEDGNHRLILGEMKRLTSVPVLL